MNHLTVQQLSAALDGALGGPSLELVVHHLAHCHECRDRQARLARNDDVMRRLLALDPHDFFLDDLERRVEALLVAIMRGLPVPPMVTTSPLQGDEDPYQPAEPPLPERPELGRAGTIAQEAGFGRIGLKPAASTQAPQSDPVEAQRLLEALERGDTGDFTELTAHGMHEPTELDGPVFDLPGWIKQRAPSDPGSKSRPREVQKLNLFFENLNDRSTNLSHEAIEETFRRESAGPVSPNAPPLRAPGPPPLPAPATHDFSAPSTHDFSAPDAPAFQAAAPPARLAPTTPALGATPTPVAPAPPPPARSASAHAAGPASTSSERPSGVISKETPWRRGPAWANAGLDPSPPYPQPHAVPVTDAYEQVNDPPRKPVPRVQPTPRFAGAWLLATATVGGLLVLVLTLQFLPPASTPGATAWRGFRFPGVEFAPGDSLPGDDSRDREPMLRSATTPVPVEFPVLSGDPSFGGSLVDSAGVIADSLAAPADTLGTEPGR